MSSKPVYHSTIKESELKNSQFEKRRVFFSRLKRKLLRHTYLIRASFVAVAVVAILLLLRTALTAVRRTKMNNYLSLVSSFMFTPEDKIKSAEGRTNFVLLGKGGQGHDAPDLTDTIIFVSVLHKDPSVVTVSLPRDIWIPALRAKLNSTYYWGNQKQEGGGLILTKSSIEEIVGKPVHYGLVIDFDGFVEVINVLDGVDVDVERGFVDEKYPIAGKEDDECNGDSEYKCRYETVEFVTGMQKMNGETALKFVRSRNAKGDEGTDIARAKRQQKVLEAIKNKTLSKEILLSSKKLSALKDVVMQATETDIEGGAAAILARRFVQARENIGTSVLPEEFLENPPTSYRYDNLYVFIPRVEGWEEVYGWVNELLGN